jgi:hypothetical protein
MASDNVLGTFVQMRPQYETLLEVDSAYRTFLDNLLNPPDLVAPLFALQAHASFRAAVGLAMQCQSAPAFMVMRGCLENSLYGLYFHRNPRSFELWLRRHDDDAARRQVRNEFQISRLKTCLEEVDRDTAEVASQLYDKTIDFGAHPNVAALATGFRTANADDRRQFQVLYLTADPEVVRGTLKSTAQAGVGSLLIFKNVFQQRFDLLGISDTLRQLRTRL